MLKKWVNSIDNSDSNTYSAVKLKISSNKLWFMLIFFELKIFNMEIFSSFAKS